jgi:hypothetical protein
VNLRAKLPDPSKARVHLKDSEYKKFSLGISWGDLLLGYGKYKNISLLAFFIVIERTFVVDAIKYIEINRHTDDFLSNFLKERWDLELIKSYI